jgi:Ca2+-binding EF-hand superfamily protein
VPISALLKSRPRLQLINHPMLSVNTGQIIAHISLDVRLALPVSELYRLFLERHPQERRHIEEIANQRVIEAAAQNELARNLGAGGITSLSPVGKEDESRLYNELEVLVHRANGLPMSADGKPPNAYVHFQLLGHPDKLTNPIMNTTAPEFNEKFSFPMVTTDQQLRLLQRSNLQLSVIDMKGEELQMKSEGLIGEVFVKLASLVEGSAISDTFNIKDADGKIVAELYVTLKWKHLLKKQRDLGPRALSGVEVETLIAAFSPGDMHEGVVDYRAFCRFIDPPPQVLGAMDKLRAFCNDIVDREGRSARDVFKMLLDPVQYTDEETFVQRMLKTQIDALPMDFVHLFKFIDSSQEERITLDKFLAVLNLDEIAGLPLVLQNKLRERSRDLANRGLPVLKMFQDSDQGGEQRLVTRFGFKDVLKKMGFALVDEPDPIHEYMGEDGRPGFDSARSGPHSARSRSSGPAGGVIEGSENDILNDTLGSEDNVLVQNDTGVAGDRQQLAPSAQEAKKQREIFEETRADFHQRSQKALAKELKNSMQAHDLQQQQKNAPGAGASTGINLLDKGAPSDSQDPYREGADHRVGIANTDAGRPKNFDASFEETKAVKLQSAFRGYSARKNRPGRESDSSFSGGGGGRARGQSNAPAADFSHMLVGAASILAVENVLYDNLKAFGSDQPLPDLASGFLKLDKKRTGLVNRKQFAHVLKQYPSVQLYGAELRAAMDFFDVSEDGTGIDYNAFLRFYRYREPELLPAILKLQTMTLSKGSLKLFRLHDTNGTGYIRRTEMLKCLKELGHGVIAQSIVQTMMQLFETRVDGQVNYVNFLEYVRESDLTQKLDVLALQFFSLITAHTAPTDPAIRNWFVKIDKPNNGKFTIQQLSLFLQENNIVCTKEAVVALYSQMDLDGVGVPFSRFSAWLVRYAENINDEQSHLSMYSSLSLAELQRKAFSYVLAIAQSAVGLEMLSESYMVYDWRRTDAGAISKALFVRATRRAGFPFTMNELRTITSEFSLQNHGEVVSYKKFLAWATPDPQTAAASQSMPFIGIAEDVGDRYAVSGSHTSIAGTHAPGIAGPGTPMQIQRNSGVISKFLEKSMLRGIDLLMVFGHYDSISVGRITSSEFCAALSDLGMSSVTQKEALELADRYRAAAGDFILYRKIVTELLRHADEVSGAADVDPVEVLRAALQSSNVDVRRLHDLFEYYDRKGNGNVRREDLATIFDEAQLRIKRFEVDSIGDKFAVGDSSWVNYVPLIKAMESRMVEVSMFKKPLALPDELSNKVKALIETLIIRGIDYRTELDKFDNEFSGSVLQSDFREVMNERLRGGLTLKELETLEKTYRFNHDPRRVHFVRMIHHLHPRNFGRVTFQAADSDAAAGEPWEVAEQLRQKIRRRCDYLTPGELRKPFMHFARSKSDLQSVSLEDFSLAVRKLGMRLASDQEKAVFEMIALGTGRKAFTYNDFVVFTCDPQHVDIIWKLRRAIARARVSEKEIITALNDQDTNASGLITAKQFIRALKSCSIELTDSDAVRLMLRFDVEGNQRFDNDRFFRFLRGRQADEEDDPDDFNRMDLAVSKRLKDESVLAAHKTAEAAETHAWSSLKRRIEDKLQAGFTGSEVFALFDHHGRGTLDVAALSHGMQIMGLKLTHPEVRSILRRMTQLAGGTVNKASFYDAFDIDLRVFEVDDRDLVGGEQGRRARRSTRAGLGASVYDVDDSLPMSGQGTGSFASILLSIKDQMELAVNPRERSNLPEVLRRALDKLSFQKPNFVTHRELSRY